MNWIDLTRGESMYVEQADTDQLGVYRHRPKRLPGLLTSHGDAPWKNDRAPDNPYWDKKKNKT